MATLTIIGTPITKHDKPQYFLRYRCSCGTEADLNVFAVRAGTRRSCGCEWRKKRLAAITKHGMFRAPEYKTWDSMKSRCRPGSKARAYYFDRGIAVCDAWAFDFRQFFSDMGPKPFPHAEIDRIDNNKGYSKDNCRWVTHKANLNNIRKNWTTIFNGKRVTMSQLSELTGININTLRARFYRGYSAATMTRQPQQGVKPV